MLADAHISSLGYLWFSLLMATEVVEVATESEEDVKINRVAIFYEEGKEGENFRRAVRFNNRLLH